MVICFRLGHYCTVCLQMADHWRVSSHLFTGESGFSGFRQYTVCGLCKRRQRDVDPGRRASRGLTLGLMENFSRLRGSILSAYQKQVESRSQKLHSGLSGERQGPRHLGHFLLLAKVYVRGMVYGNQRWDWIPGSPTWDCGSLTRCATTPTPQCLRKRHGKNKRNEEGNQE